ncbi:MAG: hypothetical protein LVQ75_02860 [Candidatus Babeliales bacterium]|jgi:hypothetical protein
MFGLCFLSIINAQEEVFPLVGGFATLHSEINDQMEIFPPTSPSDSSEQSESDSAKQAILDDAFQGFAALKEQYERVLRETQETAAQNTRATELLGQIVTAQSELLIDVQRKLESNTERLAAISAELAASRITRELESKAHYARRQEDNEALALIGGVLFGIGFAYQVMLDNINGGSSGHH